MIFQICPAVYYDYIRRKNSGNRFCILVYIIYKNGGITAALEFPPLFRRFYHNIIGGKTAELVFPPLFRCFSLYKNTNFRCFYQSSIDIPYSSLLINTIVLLDPHDV